jgi:hypothetical protein
MQHQVIRRKFASLALSSALILSTTAFAQNAEPDDRDQDSASVQVIPNTGQLITPTAPTGARFEPLNPGLASYPTFLAGQAVTSVVSPNGKTLLILTSGYNLLNFPSGPNVGTNDPSAGKPPAH